jgi:hypothetical protein
MDKLFGLNEPFGLSYEEIEYLRSCRARRVCFAPAYSVAEAICLAAGASLKAGRLVAIMVSEKDRITAWPLWNVEQRCAFVLGFRFDRNWRPIAWVAEETSLLSSTYGTERFSRADRAWDWAGYANLALDTGWLENGPPIFNGRFRTSYPETLLTAFEALLSAQTRQQKPSQEQKEHPSHPSEHFLKRRGLSGFSNC